MQESYMSRIQTELQEGKTAKYPMLRAEVMSFLIPFGTTSVSHPIAKLGKQPIRIYLAMVENETLNGVYKKNPLKFLPHDLANASFIINGKTFPTTPLHMSFVKDDLGNVISGEYLRTLNELERTTGVLGLNDGVNIDRSKYVQGFFVLGQKTTEAAADNHFAPSTQGSLVINLQFSKPVPALSCIVYLEYQNMMTINALGVVQLDYTA